MASKAAEQFSRDAFADKLIAIHGGWPDMEGLIRDLYAGRVAKGRCMVDVGVNHGTHFVQMARTVGPGGQVIGFEAVPELARRTAEAIRTHYPDIVDSVTLHQVAVSDRPGTATFYFSTINDSGLSGLSRRNMLREGEVEEISVPVRVIDDYLDRAFIDRLDFAKFDIEGAEYHALKGARKILQRRPLLTFEWDKSAPAHFGYQPADLFDLIVSHGYAIHDLFGFAYDDVAALVSAKPWNFVAVPLGMPPAHALQPAIDSLRRQFPDLF